MTILQLVLTYAPAWSGGGPPRIMYDYGRSLAAAGHRIIVLAPDSNRPASDSAWGGLPAGIEIHYYRKTGDWRRGFYFDYSRRELRRFFDTYAGEIDLIHLAQTRCLPNLAALEASRRHGIPIALSSFGSLPRRHGIGKWFYDQLFVGPLVQQAKLLLAQTDHECATYAAFGGRREAIKLLPLAVDLARVAAPAPDVRSQFCRRFDIPADCHLFLFLGRLHPTKGLATLVRTFARVRSTTPRAFLAIVGNDEGCAAEVRDLAAALGVTERIRLCGPLYDDERWSAYQAADTFVITPAIYEETSLASIEALACGTPVITNTRADIPRLHDYGAGMVAPAGDDATVVAAMLELASEDSATMMRRRAAAARLTREQFELGAVTRRFADYASEICRTRQPHA